MKTERTLFVYLVAFFVVVTPIYWWMSQEIIGTVALLLTLAFCGMIAAFFSIQARKMDPRPEDRADAEVLEGAGEVGFFPSSSIWPFWVAMSLTVIALGPVFGWWISLIGIGLGIWSMSGWVFQYYRGDFQH